MKLKIIFLFLLICLTGKQAFGEGIKAYSYSTELEFVTTKTGEFTFSFGLTMLNHIKDPELINEFPSVYIYWNDVKQEISWFDAQGLTKVSSPIPLTGNTKVTISCPIYHPVRNFVCNDNEVTEINFAPSTNLYSSKYLQRLECNNNSLTALNISDLKYLTKLDCSFNSISALNFNAETQSILESVDCSNNKIGKLILKDFKLLNYLHCNNNILEELTLTNLKNLSDLDCNSNNLTKLLITDCPSIENLVCGRNPLSKLELTGFDKLKELRCYLNNLTSLDISGMKNLENIDYEANNISDFNFVSEKLKVINCAGNSIKSIDLNGLPNLQHFICSENELTYLDVSMLDKLISLNCSENKIKELIIGELPQLSQLSCLLNKLTNLDLAALPKLRQINCSANFLTTLDLSKNLNIKYIYCDGNYIENINVSGLKNLDELRCINNSLSFSSLPNIYLDYETNNIGAVGKGYYFSEQRRIVEKTKKPHNTTIDLSSEYAVAYPDGAIAYTTYRWYDYSRYTKVPIDSSSYTENQGTFAFDAELAGKRLLCEMTNPVFWRETISPHTKLTLEYIVELSVNNEVVVENPTEQISNNQGSFELQLHNPESLDLIDGSFIINFPKGFILNEQASQLNPNMKQSHTVYFEKQGESTWLVKIEKKTTRSNASIPEVSKIMDIAYTIQNSVENGSYNIKVADLALTFYDAPPINQSDININVNVDGMQTGIAPKENNTDITIYTQSGSLFIDTPYKESISIYTIDGRLIYNGIKYPGLTTIDGLNNNLLIIIKGTSGWIEKIKF